MRSARDVTVYSVGLIFCSACAPATVRREQVEEAVNYLHPTGLDHGWKVSDENFRTGESNPCQCPDEPNHRHWLLSC